MSEIEYNINGLDALLKAMKATPPIAKVGILGNGARSDGGPSNATIGAAHEFGTTKLPVRSFLRIPISERLEKEMEASGALDKDALQAVISTKSLIPYMKKIAVLAEGIVIGAFGSNGYGKWQAWKAGYSSKSGNILVDTNQLRDSITSEVTG